MKKSLSLLLTAIITVSILTSCANKDTNVPEGFKEISDDAIGYDLYVPEDWISDISTGITSAYFSNTDPSNISMTSSFASAIDNKFSMLPSPNILKNIFNNK